MNVLRNEHARILAGLTIALALLAPFLIYFDTAQSIISIWNSSETFAHGYIILPISLWLVWKRRHVFTNLPLAPFWPALALLAVCGFGWLLAELADVQVVRQYAFVAMIPIAAIALLGLRISWSLAFPLLFLMLAVPFGEVFMHPLINFTADFTVAALQSTGIPVWRDGTHFSIPSGDWSVVEACSGLRYLIASFTLGCLYAYLTYRSPVRRGIFIALSILIPIIANGMRAYIIVMIGHLIGMEHAVGVDHLIYGWLFFGVVMFLMYWIGNFWREEQEAAVPDPTEADLGLPHTRPVPSGIFAVALGVLACMAMWPGAAGYIERSGFNPAPVELAGFRGRWHEATPFTKWKPYFSTPNAELTRFFERDGKQAGITVLYYRNQNGASKLISSDNRLVSSEDDLWRMTSTSAVRESVADRPLIVRESRIRGRSDSLLVWHWYWIDGKFLANDYAGKLLQAKGKILMAGDDGASIFAYAPFGENPDEARTVLRAFLAENLTVLETTLAQNKKHPALNRND